MLPFTTFDVLTFDCYGTLIDWETGIWQALQPILVHHGIAMGMDEALERYAAFESDIERGEYQAYRVVLRLVLEAFGKQHGFTPTPQELQQFSTSVKDWPAFADTPGALRALKTRYKLAIVSNIDDDLFTLSAPRLAVPFDWIITAQQAGSYKPSAANFHLALERIGAPQQAILHVAQSLFHDIAPAQALGMATVWVNRRHDKPGAGATPPAQARADLEVPDLQTLVDLMGLA